MLNQPNGIDKDSIQAGQGHPGLQIPDAPMFFLEYFYLHENP